MHKHSHTSFVHHYFLVPAYQGPVVQSIISFMTLLVIKSCSTNKIRCANILLGKIRGLLHCKTPHIFSAKKAVFLHIMCLKF